MKILQWQSLWPQCLRGVGATEAFGLVNVLCLLCAAVYLVGGSLGSRFHGAVLLEIERGLIKWGGSFMHLENRTLFGQPLPETSTTKPPVKSSSSNSSPLPLLFCCDYQRDALCLILLFLTSLFLTTAGITYPRFVRSLLTLNKRFWLRRNLACVQTPPSLRKNRRRGFCDSPSLIVYGGHVIFLGMCRK